MTNATPSLDLQRVTISPFHGDINLRPFRCGDSDLDKFISGRANKYHGANRLRIFYAHYVGSNIPLGVYALSMIFEETQKLSSEEAQRATGKQFPAIYLGTLAVLRQHQCSGLGTIMLINALRRCYMVSQNVAVFAVALKSLNERTTKLYRKYGFAVRDDGQTPLMILPIWTLADLFGAVDRQGS